MSEKNRITRREFFKNTAVVVGAGAASASVLGALTPTPAIAATVPKKWDKEADLIVVGSGATGLCAAVAAVDKGASVIILEHGKEVGGCSVISSGSIDLQGGTRIQKLNNMEDTPEFMFKRYTSYKNNNIKRDDWELMRAFCNANPGTIDWLEQHGVRFFNNIASTGIAGPVAKATYMYHRIWWDKEWPGASGQKTATGVASGAGLVKPLEAYVLGKGVKILTEHKMTRIIRKDGMSGKVLGVEVMAGKKKLNFKAKKAVVLGSGGWKGNKTLRKLFDSRATEDLPDTGCAFVNSDGSGIIAALQIGAVLTSDRAMDEALYRKKYGTRQYNYPLNSPYGAPGLAITGANMADVLYVNKFGQRFVNEQEVGTFGDFNQYDAMLAQEGHLMWTIFDDAAAKKNKWILESPVTEKGCAFSASTMTELADLIKVPADALNETVNNYNGYVEAGKDPDFDKPKNLLKAKIEAPPFHAVWISLQIHDTCGGLTINAKAQVLDIFGKVIPGLYAGGETIGGIGRVGLPRCVIFGRIAGEDAAG